MFNHHSLVRTGVLAVALLAGTALTAVAAPVNFDFTSSGGTQTGTGTLNNQRVYSTSVPGLTVTVTGWTATGSGGQLDRANVGQYGGFGLGVCTSGDGGVGCDDPLHQVDNMAAQEFLLFQFSLPVDPTSVVIDPSGTYDRDVRYYVGSAALTLATVDASLPSAIGTVGNYTDSVGSSPRTVAIAGTTPVYTLLVGVPKGPTTDSRGRITGCPTDGSDCDADFWKLESLLVDYTAAPPPPPSGAGDVPAPGTLALFGAALAGLGAVRRRRA